MQQQRVTRRDTRDGWLDECDRVEAMVRDAGEKGTARKSLEVSLGWHGLDFSPQDLRIVSARRQSLRSVSYVPPPT